MFPEYVPWICSLNMFLEYIPRICSLNMFTEYVPWICSLNVPWTCSLNILWMFPEQMFPERCPCVVHACWKMQGRYSRARSNWTNLVPVRSSAAHHTRALCGGVLRQAWQRHLGHGRGHHDLHVKVLMRPLYQSIRSR
jgi:hypothetical protein